MKKIEQTYREILDQAIKNKKHRFTQLGLSKKIGASTSTINSAIKQVQKIGAINIKKRCFTIKDIEKILIYWATKRNLKKDIIYQTRINKNIGYIEKHMPAKTIYTAYSAYKFRFNDVPADYSEVIVYSDKIEDIKSRFPKKKGPANLIVLKKDKNMKETASIAQIYVDLWNLETWYAKEFLKAIKNKIMVE